MTAQAIAADNALTALALTPGGNLDAYVRAVQQFPMLSQAREERSGLAARVARAELSGRLISWSSERVVVESRRGRPKAPGSRDRD